MATGFPIIFGSGARGTWTPAQISTALWLDAADSSTITLNGSNVSQWSDKSGNGRNATQTTASSQPTYTTDSNGKPTLSYDGTNDVLNFSAINARTFFMVTRAGATNQDAMLWGHSTVPFHSAAGTILSSFSSASVLNGEKYVNGVSRPSATDYIAVSLSNRIIEFVTTANVSASTIGNDPRGPSRFLRGTVQEAIIITGAIDTATRQQLEGYLAWKWELQADLPANHPYKLLPPTV